MYSKLAAFSGHFVWFFMATLAAKALAWKVPVRRSIGWIAVQHRCRSGPVVQLYPLYPLYPLSPDQKTNGKLRWNLQITYSWKWTSFFKPAFWVPCSFSNNVFKFDKRRHPTINCMPPHDSFKTWGILSSMEQDFKFGISYSRKMLAVLFNVVLTCETPIWLYHKIIHV